MLHTGEKYNFFPTETNKHKEVATVCFVENTSVRQKEEGDKILGHKYNAPLAYSCTTHQIEDLYPEASYNESWIPSKDSILEIQFSYQKTSSLCTNHTSLIEEAQPSHHQTQIQPCLPPTTNPSLQLPLGSQDLLHIGAQFYGQISHSQMEHPTYQQRLLASSEIGADAEKFKEIEIHGDALLDLQGLIESYLDEEPGS